MEKNTKHIAGIVSAYYPRGDFKFDWPDYMMPVGNNYLAIERAVFECAYAGCSSIWVVCNNDVPPLIRRRMKDFVVDPGFMNFEFRHELSYYKKIKQCRNVPIFYVPMHQKYKNRIDSLGFSILHGARYAETVSNKLSKGTAPDMYYVAFPQAAYEPKVVRPFRRQMYKGIPVMAMFDGKSVKNDEYLGFSFKPSDMKSFIEIIRAGARVTYRDENDELQRLPLENRYEAKDYTLSKIFGNYNPQEIFTKTIKWYQDISKWDTYSKFIGSDYCSYLNYANKKPTFLKARTYVEIIKEEGSNV
jgi:hypothetical protein